MKFISAPPGELYWRAGKPPSSDAKVLLLTIGGTCVVGQWYGVIGFAFTHWCPLPRFAPILNLRSRITLAWKILWNSK